MDFSDSGQVQLAGCRENGNEFPSSKTFGVIFHYLIITNFTWRTLLHRVTMRTFVNMLPKTPCTKLHNKKLNNFYGSQYCTFSQFRVNKIGDSCNKHKGHWERISILNEIFDSNMTLERANLG